MNRFVHFHQPNNYLDPKTQYPILILPLIWALLFFGWFLNIWLHLCVCVCVFFFFRNDWCNRVRFCPDTIITFLVNFNLILFFFGFLVSFAYFIGSQILKVWRTFMEEWEQTAKQLKTNAEFLESLCQDKLTHLYQDKRKARKNYQEEHQKIATQFTNVSSVELVDFIFICFFFDLCVVFCTTMDVPLLFVINLYVLLSLHISFKQMMWHSRDSSQNNKKQSNKNRTEIASSLHSWCGSALNGWIFFLEKHEANGHQPDKPMRRKSLITYVPFFEWSNELWPSVYRRLETINSGQTLNQLIHWYGIKIVGRFFFRCWPFSIRDWFVNISICRQCARVKNIFKIHE